ncbi:MAG: hypothetical protein RLZZ136_460 [Pseudomonadota bacterium]|jgi:phosphopantothenoylcysteine decarboxylase/phosphopantothenate--cysteine ligase
MSGPRILLIVGGGIAAYKACELVRLIRKNGGSVNCVMTEGGSHFVTAMTLAALSENPVHTTLWDLKNEVEMGHIRLSREADLIVACPATADLMARMAAGIADDLATTLLLATDKPVMVVPAMNVRMWQHAATQRNVQTLRDSGCLVLDPDEGEMACGEYGPGRLPDPEAIWAQIAARLSPQGPLSGQHVLVTAGPTHEPIDPVRYIANRSSGKQGFAIAAAAARLGARVTLVSGPVNLATPAGVDRRDVETAQQMADAVAEALPADCAIMVAAVADWRTKAVAPSKMKKRGADLPVLSLTENPDILATVAAGASRPRLLVGFAAETDDVLAHASEKRLRKGADWIVANDVSTDVMGGEMNQVHIVSPHGVESLALLPKSAVAMAIMERIADALKPNKG